MNSIPSVTYGTPYRSVSLEEGVHRLTNEMGLAAIAEIIGGMLYHNGTVMLASCDTPDQRFMCQARAQILREMHGYLTARLENIDENGEETE